MRSQETSVTVWRSCAAIVALCLAIGLPTVRSDNYFLGDDFGLVQHLHDLPIERMVSYFGSDWTEGIYGVQLDELRPILAFTYWLDARIFGTFNVTGYHITNVLLHALNALLVLAIARSIAPREPRLALLASALFALMPSHAEPIAWISGRVDSLAALFHFGAFLCFVRFRLSHRRGWLFASLAIFVGGLFAKQSLVTFPLLILSFDLLGPGSANRPAGRSLARLWPHAPFFVVAGSYLVLRQTLFGNAVREDLLTAAAIKEFVVRQQFYARELLPTANSWPRLMKVIAETLTLCALAACARWLLVRRPVSTPVVERVRFFGAAWYIVTIAPMVVTYASVRHLYITAAGVSITLASLILPRDSVETPQWTRIRTAICAGLLVLYGMASIGNISAWVTSGIESQRFASAVPRLLQSVPRGSVVFVDVPAWNRDGWFWSWATPFALQPPFMADDLDEEFRIVERPPVYCCPPDQWWTARRAALMALIDSPAPQQVAQIVFARDNPGGPALTTRMVDGPDLRRRIETTLGKPVESLATSITSDEAQELSRILFD